MTKRVDVSSICSLKAVLKPDVSCSLLFALFVVTLTLFWPGKPKVNFTVSFTLGKNTSPDVTYGMILYVVPLNFSMRVAHFLHVVVVMV